jgi:hypothetical protein
MCIPIARVAEGEVKLEHLLLQPCQREDQILQTFALRTYSATACAGA